MKKEATKFNAVRSVANRYNIPLENVVAFGDDDNEKVKAVSDAVTTSNEADGVAVWLKKNILA